MLLYRRIMFLSRLIRSYESIIITLLSGKKHNNYASLRKHIYYASMWKHNNYASIMLFCKIIQSL